MSVVDQVEAIKQARQAMEWLEKHPDTTRRQLGKARDLLNRVHNLNDHEQIWDAVGDLESMVCGIYGGRPD